jgi:hypothetical protein
LAQSLVHSRTSGAADEIGSSGEGFTGTSLFRGNSHLDTHGFSLKLPFSLQIDWPRKPACTKACDGSHEIVVRRKFTTDIAH